MFKTTVEVQTGTEIVEGPPDNPVKSREPVYETVTVEVAFGPSEARLSPNQLHWRKEAARRYLTERTNTFRHYSGEHYRVTGFHTDAATGEVRVDYQSVDHAGRSRSAIGCWSSSRR